MGVNNMKSRSRLEAHEAWKKWASQIKPEKSNQIYTNLMEQNPRLSLSSGWRIPCSSCGRRKY